MSLPIYAYSSLSSTSDRAQEFLESGTRPPFAVLAAEQSMGRGQRGRGWASPRGGLYITIVLPASVLSAPKEQLSWVPLKIAVLTARWIDEQWGLRITLKWPNDLLFAGRKLGGILCSTSMQGDTCNALSIGVGINISTAPHHGGDYQAISLAELVPGPFQVEALARSYAHYIEQEFASLGWEQLCSAYLAYHIGEGHLWRLANLHCLNRAISPQGELQLEHCTSEHSLELISSAGQHYQWAYQAYTTQSTPPLIVADIGNSKIKIALYASAYHPDIETQWSVAPLDSRALVQCLLELRQHLLRLFPTAQNLQGWPIFCSEVNAAFFAIFAAAAAQQDFTAIPLAKRRVRVKPGGYTLTELGIDRLATIEGWLGELNLEQRAQAEEKALIMSLGTATTCDVVGANGVHFGGLIVAGMETNLRSLHEATHLLPLLSLEDTPEGHTFLGRSTQDAMLQGALHQTLGLAERLYKRYRCTSLVLTGGFASLLSTSFDPQLHVELRPDLTLKGIRVLALGGVHR
jgi:biotin-[acetyl-CoA-carboxylase] ligase BirA-like protein